MGEDWLKVGEVGGKRSGLKLRGRKERWVEVGERGEFKVEVRGRGER